MRLEKSKGWNSPFEGACCSSVVSALMMASFDQMEQLRSAEADKVNVKLKSTMTEMHAKHVISCSIHHAGPYLFVLRVRAEH